MYQSLKTYSPLELEDLLSNLDSYSQMKKPPNKEVIFHSELTDLQIALKAETFAIPYWTYYTLGLYDVKFKDQGFVKAIELLWHREHYIELSYQVEPSMFWKDYLSLDNLELWVTFEYNNDKITLWLSPPSVKNKDDLNELITKMSDDGFEVIISEFRGKHSSKFGIVIDKKEIDWKSCVLSNYVMMDSLGIAKEGSLNVRMNHLAYPQSTPENYYESRFNADLIFWQSICDCFDEKYKPSTDINSIKLIYNSNAYIAPYWNISNSMVNSKPLEIPIGKLNDNGPRDHYIVWKQVLKDGYKLAVEHSKLADAELPEQFDAVDFELIED